MMPEVAEMKCTLIQPLQKTRQERERERKKRSCVWLYVGCYRDKYE